MCKISMKSNEKCELYRVNKHFGRETVNESALDERPLDE